MKSPIKRRYPVVAALSLLAIIPSTPLAAQEAEAAPEVALPPVETQTSDAKALENPLLEELQSLLESMKSEGESLEKLEKVGDLYLEIGDRQRAVIAYEKAIRDFGATEPLLLKMSQVFHEYGKPDLAIRTLKLGQEAYPESKAFSYELGRVYVESNKPYAAVTNLKKALEIDPEDSMARFYLGDAYRLQERWTEASALADALLAEELEYEPLYILKGDLLLTQGDLKEGLEFLKNAREKYPESGDIQELLSLAYQLFAYSEADSGKVEEGIANMRKARELSPNSVRPIVGLGTLLTEDEKFDEAAELYRKALEMSPNYLEAYLLYGRVLEQMERMPEARAVYGQGLARARTLGAKGAEQTFQGLLGGAN